MTAERTSALLARLGTIDALIAVSKGSDWLHVDLPLEDARWLYSLAREAVGLRSGTEGATAHAAQLAAIQSWRLSAGLTPEQDAALCELAKSRRASSSLGEPTPTTTCLSPGDCQWASRGWCPKCEPITTSTVRPASLARLYGQFPGATTGEPTDTERLDWLVRYQGQVCSTLDGEVFWVIWSSPDREESFTTDMYEEAHDALDEAMSRSAPPQEQR